MFRVIRPLLCALPLAASPLLTAQEGPDPRGAYDFTSTSLRGAPFSGTVHLYGEPGAIRGFIYTTIDPPIPVEEVRWLGGDTLAVQFRLGPMQVTQLMGIRGDSIGGHLVLTRDGTEERIPLTGRRRSRSGRADLDPSPCEVAGVRGEARCAMLHVPENPDDTTGRWIPLRVVILPALAATPEPDAMFTFAGGPGQAATEVAGAYAQTMAGIRRTRDIVIIDQRGTGASNPLRCEFTDPDARAQLLLTWRFPEADLDRCREALARDADLRLYHSWIAAADADRVRAWLGYPRINLYGGSYGSRMGLAYLARFPERTRTATLRAVLPPEGVLARDGALNAAASVATVIADCQAEPACAAAYPALADELAAVVRQLEDAPASIRVRDPVTRDTVVIALTRSVFSGALRRLLMDGDAVPNVPYVIRRAAAGDFAPLAPGIAATLEVSRALYIGMSLSVGCAEDAHRLGAAAGDPEIRATFMGDGAVRGFAAACDRWPGGAVPPAFQQPVRAATPVLLLSGRYDPATPPGWGAQVARTLPQALHLVMPGVSHSPFPSCAQDIMTAFVERGGAAGVDTSCVQSLARPPFRLP